MINSKEELPEKWMVRVTKENINILNEYRYKHYSKNNTLHKYMFMAVEGSGHDGGNGYEEITFEEFKKYVLNMETKKILTYKLVREEYADACIKITGFDGTPKTFMEYRLAVDGNFVAKLRTAGVLDLWFESVYEKQERVINMGSFNLTIKPKGIFHSNENITDFVAQATSNNRTLITNKKYAGYDFTVKDVIISKTGCENSETKLSQWLAVWEEYVKIKQ